MKHSMDWDIHPWAQWLALNPGTAQTVCGAASLQSNHWLGKSRPVRSPRLRLWPLQQIWGQLGRPETVNMKRQPAAWRGLQSTRGNWLWGAEEGFSRLVSMTRSAIGPQRQSPCWGEKETFRGGGGWSRKRRAGHCSARTRNSGWRPRLSLGSTARLQSYNIKTKPLGESKCLRFAV